MGVRKWLKQCSCGVRYWGDNRDSCCNACINKESKSNNKKKCGCGCGEEFTYFININPKYERKYFSRACQMRARRRTTQGREYMEQYNKRYKRIELEWICQYPECGKMILDTRKRTLCDEHSDKQPVGHQKLLRKRRPDIKKSYLYTDNLRKKIKRGTLIEPPCNKCGSSGEIQFHHTDYNKPEQVTPLCSECHKVEHRELATKQKQEKF